MSEFKQVLAAREASDYFNSLPREERVKLGPLLEEYRRMGMAEYAREVKAAARRMDNRMRNIEREPEFNPLGGAARGVGNCVCAAGPGTNPACQVHP